VNELEIQGTLASVNTGGDVTSCISCNAEADRAAEIVDMTVEEHRDTLSDAERGRQSGAIVDMTVEEHRDTLAADAERGRCGAIVDTTFQSPDTEVDLKEGDADHASVRRKLNFTDLRNTTTSPAAGKEEEADSDVEEVPADHGKVRQITPLVGKHKKGDSDVELLSADYAKVLRMFRNAASNTRPSVLKNFYCFNGARNEFAKRTTDQQTRQDSCLKIFKSVGKEGICELELFNLRNWYKELRFSNIDTPVPGRICVAFSVCHD
jgi:hypothetical protein